MSVSNVKTGTYFSIYVSSTSKQVKTFHCHEGWSYPQTSYINPNMLTVTLAMKY